MDMQNIFIELTLVGQLSTIHIIWIKGEKEEKPGVEK